MFAVAAGLFVILAAIVNLNFTSMFDFFREHLAAAYLPSLRPENGDRGYDLRLMSSLNDVNGIPTEGKNLIVVAAVDNDAPTSVSSTAMARRSWTLMRRG